MSATLMAEVLDGYHGADKRKLWLLAWAERANTATRSGWCPRSVIAARLGVSDSRASHIAAELVAEGVLKRDGIAHHGHSQRFVLGDLNGTQRVRASAHPFTDPEGCDDEEIPF